MKLTDPSTLFLFLLAAMVVLLMLRTRMRVGALGKPGSEIRGGDEAAGASPAPDELARWEVEMHETARELSAQLDAKLSLLQSLIAEADRAARHLQELLDRVSPQATADDGESAGECGTGPDDSGLPLADQESAASGNRALPRDEVYQLADYGFAPAEIARRVGRPVGEVDLILSLRESRDE